MLIGFDASRAFGVEHTGTENYSLNLLKALAKVDRRNQYRVYLRGSRFTLPSSGQAVHGSQNKKTVNRQRRTGNLNWPSNFEFVHVRPSRLWTQVGLALETWRSPVDVLFVPAHTLPIFRRRSFIVNSSWGKFLLSRLTINDQRLTKYVVTIHDLGVEYLPNYHKFPQNLYLDFASKYAARHADSIIAVSAATKRDLEVRYKVDGSKAFAVHEGVDTSFFKPSLKLKVQSVKSKYGIQGDYILFVGTVQPRKNLEMLIRAFSRVARELGSWDTWNPSNLTTQKPSCQLIIAGKLGWDYREILDAPQKYGVEKQVKFLNYVSKQDLPALYSGAAVFAFPSLFEGFGLPILEALSCGCPVIASDIAPHREIRFSVLGSRLSDKQSLRSKDLKQSLRFSSFDKLRTAGLRSQSVSQLTGQQKIDKQISENRQQRTDNDLLEAIVLVKANDPNDWARFLYQYISQYDIRRSLVTDRRKLASKFTWDETAKQTVDVLKRLV